MTQPTFCSRFFIIIAILWLWADPLYLQAQGVEGYYRFPDIYENTVSFTAEGDLWLVPLSGGLAQRLTTHTEEEQYSSISPDGKIIAYSASYEGPTEVYTMPITGGLPTRWTYESEGSYVNTWTPDGKLIYHTIAYNGVPDEQLVSINPATREKEVLPLFQASESSFDGSGQTVYFVRPANHNDAAKRYKGGTARQVWKYTLGSEEAIKLTTSYTGESHHPLWINGRVYFISDRDGVMNIWSMNEGGGDLTQHTQHTQFDIRYANSHGNHLVYQHGADIWHLDLEKDSYTRIPITLMSDLDQLREKWEMSPQKYITSAHPDQKGDKLVITARGRVFVVPVKGGRSISFTEPANVRYRDAIFSSDGKSILTLSDESGEFEFVSFPANGTGDPTAISSDGEILRYQGIPSPDGKWLAYDDLANDLYILNLESGVSKKISTNQEGIGSFSWSPDSKWLAFMQSAPNTMSQIHVYSLETTSAFPLTTDRANSFSPQWSPDGKFIYFLSDRNFQTLVGSPWGSRQPEPYFDASEKIYQVALEKGSRSPFRETDEIYEEEQAKKEDKEEENDEDVKVVIDQENIQSRIEEVPISPGNYYSLSVTDKALYYLARETGVKANTHLMVVSIKNEDIKATKMLSDVRRYEVTADNKKMLIYKASDFYMVDAGTSALSDISKKKVKMNGWKFTINPREDWKQIFTDAWRMERDYFYDANMHGVDWEGMHEKYAPLVDRVTCREELSDLIMELIGELSALHTSVRGGDEREDPKNISIANLGATFKRNEERGGYEITYIYQADPDYPNEKSPLDDPYLDVDVGDVITHVNGKAALESVDIGELIRNQVGKQVRLSLAKGDSQQDIIVKPQGSTYWLRYKDWEYGNRKKVDEKSQDQIGYLHLSAMGSFNISQFYREFYPVFDRPGIIIDMRYNYGGNIDSFILEKLMRKAWMYWKARTGKPYWNMQYAFTGHIVVLVNENTYSDGETFAHGFKELGLGTTLGTRTWGGQIWLNSANRLTDGGIARAPMFGVYGNNGEWLIEGHGYEPDIIVDNLPHETFKGKDAQLEAAIEFLQRKIAEEPREAPAPPAYPDKSFDYQK
ncbi:MAG: S41 family peptidase [Bacteroidota bacterium]